MHLFGGPGEIHMHSSLIRISFKLSWFPFWLLDKATSLPSLSNLWFPQAARSSLVVLSLGQLKRSRQLYTRYSHSKLKLIVFTPLVKTSFSSVFLICQASTSPGEVMHCNYIPTSLRADPLPYRTPRPTRI